MCVIVLLVNIERFMGGCQARDKTTQATIFILLILYINICKLQRGFKTEALTQCG